MNANQNRENKLTLDLLDAIEQKDDISQRHLAQHMGIALGLANSYLKRCVKKGLIKITTAPANRYLYYLTPTGFSEKARLTGEFLSTSLTLFRQAGDVYTSLFNDCVANGKSRVVLAGMSDLTEIAYIRSLGTSVDVVGIYQPDCDIDVFLSLPVSAKFLDEWQTECVVITALENSADMQQILVNELQGKLSQENILLPSFLSAIRFRKPDAESQSQASY